MGIVDSLSRFGGLEYLQMRRPELLRDLEEAAAAACQFGSYVARQWRDHLVSRGWSEVNALLLRDRVAAAAFPTSAELWSILGAYIALYENDAVDVGVEILPATALRDELDELSADHVCYEDEAKRLSRRGHGPVLPIALFGVAL